MIKSRYDHGIESSFVSHRLNDCIGYRFRKSSIDWRDTIITCSYTLNTREGKGREGGGTNRWVLLSYQQPDRVALQCPIQWMNTDNSHSLGRNTRQDKRGHCNRWILICPTRVHSEILRRINLMNIILLSENYDIDEGVSRSRKGMKESLVTVR